MGPRVVRAPTPGTETRHDAPMPAWRDRIDEAERAIEDRGGKLVDTFVTLGRYDLVEIVEAPDDETAAQILLTVMKHGAVTTETLRGFTRDEAENIVRGI